MAPTRLHTTAAAIASGAAAAFPTQALRAELETAPQSEYFGRYQSGLETFFDRNRGFDLRNGPYSARNGRNGADPFRGIPDKDAVKDRLVTITRLFRALPEPAAPATAAAGSGPVGSFATIIALADKGYLSSSAISTAPRAQFVTHVSARREDDAYWGRVHDRATAVRDVAWLKGIDLLHSYRQPFGVIKGLRDEPAEAGVADLRTLFGSLDMCDCEACTSITSPAAYLADVLNFLGTEVATARTSPYQVLTARRPDIPHILLNCDNMNRLLPYIDLVNELLEDYLDNLIDWGDQQFNLFTMESTNEATLLYTLAAEILGRRPEKIPPRARPVLQTYSSLGLQAAGTPAGPSSDAWRNFSDLMVEIEAYIAPAAVPGGTGSGSALGRMWAFCIPANANLLDYWTRVADRLFKLRHCQDIAGAERKIPLWDPPIDPALLVRAAAAGVDLASVLSDVNAALPNYRFTVILPKALELCNELRNFGALLLSALEKKDGETLARLRSQHEVDLLKAVRTVKSNQLAESTALRDAAEKSRLTIEARRDHYRDIAFLIPAEQTALALSGSAVTQEIAAAVSDTLAAVAAWVPQYSGGTSGFYSSPVVVTAYGGEQVSRAASAAGSAARSVGAVLSAGAAISQTVGSFLRRQEEWQLQETLADSELDQVQKQIDAATIREAIAQAELDNHDRQTDQAKAVDDYLRGKYTNRELYSWMQSQLSALYFQTYKLAFETAKTAERAFRHELGLPDSDFVQFGYWDNLKSGLLAGERLQTDLRRMEAAYLTQNRREFEITKHVSLAALNPAALVALKAVGTCEVDLPEWLYDLDYPGHYLRRIKSVALSIPCVTGRYTNVNCTLTQSFSKVRTVTTAADYDDAAHYHENFGNTQSIVTSTARQDSGLFELSFRDDRYLPFEGTGAISRRRIQLPREQNRFDVGTVSDVIFHIHYTARDGGEALREAARATTKRLVSTGVRAFDARADFASEWYRFKNPETGQDPELTLQLGSEHFPFHSRDDSIDIKSIELISAVNENAASSLKLGVALTPKSPATYTLATGSGPGALRSQEQKLAGALADIVISGQAADVAGIEELLVLCRYEVPAPTQP